MRDEKCLPKDVAIYAFFFGKIDKFGNLTGVKDLKMAMYCPQGSGTLRQQLLMMHGSAWNCMVLHGMVWYCMVL